MVEVCIICNNIDLDLVICCDIKLWIILYCVVVFWDYKVVFGFFFGENDFFIIFVKYYCFCRLEFIYKRDFQVEKFVENNKNNFLLRRSLRDVS